VDRVLDAFQVTGITFVVMASQLIGSLAHVASRVTYACPGMATNG